MIVKVQRPLSHPAGPWLVYDRGRKLYAAVPASKLPVAVKNAMGDDFEAYFDVEADSYRITAWGDRRFDPQDW